MPAIYSRDLLTKMRHNNDQIGNKSELWFRSFDIYRVRLRRVDLVIKHRRPRRNTYIQIQYESTTIACLHTIVRLIAYICVSGERVS